jgi:hypothetical protein
MCPVGHLVDLGAIIHAAGAIITIHLLWETIKEYLKNSKSWTVSCKVHEIGTPNHDAVAILRRYGVKARTSQEAIALVKPAMEEEMKSRFGTVGFHIQHCFAW